MLCPRRSAGVTGNAREGSARTYTQAAAGLPARSRQPRHQTQNFYSALDSWIFDEIKSMEADIIIVDLSPDKDQGIITIEKIVEISMNAEEKAMFDNSERKRLYKEARTFLKLRAQRHKWVKDNRKEEAPTPEPAKA